MGNTPFFSVIMPVYGVERYLESAIQSVLNQTLTDFELLLVDDKSPDNCPKICDEYAQRDARVQVIHKPKNQGLGMARNTGMAKAAGEYILFMDSDDTIQQNTLQLVKDSLTPIDEIVVFGVTRVHENANGEVTYTEAFPCTAAVGNTVRQSGEIFLQLTQEHVFPYAWNKAYSRKFLQSTETLFETTKLIEDFLFNIEVFAKAEHIKVIPDCLYNYRKPAHQTLVNTYSPQFYDLAKRKFTLEQEFLHITGNNTFEARQIVLYSHIKHIVSVFLRNKSKGAHLSGKKQRALIRSILNDETTRETLDEFVPKGLVQKVLCFVLKQKMVFTCYVMITLVDFK